MIPNTKLKMKSRENCDAAIEVNLLFESRETSWMFVDNEIYVSHRWYLCAHGRRKCDVQKPSYP